MSRSQPSVLWVTAEIPDRRLGGGNIRQAHLLGAVAAAFPTDLLVVGHLREEGLRNTLRRVTELPPPPPWQPPRGPVKRRIRELGIAVAGRSTFDAIAESGQRDLLDQAIGDVGDHDVVMVEHSTMASLVRRRRRNEAWVLTLQNIESERSRQTAALAPGRRQRYVWERDAVRARRHEARALREYDAVVTVCDEDARALPEPSVVVPNGVDVERFRTSPLPAAPMIAMTGSLNFPPNADGAVWFCREVLPIVRRAVPAVQVTIAGRRPTAEVAGLADLEGVRVVADPDDVLPILLAARVAVVPLRVGSGTRLKALEAMACGRPVVGTTTGLDGLGIVDRVHARVADDADEMARAVAEVIESDVHASSLAAAGRELAEQFDWRNAASRLTDLVRELGCRQHELSER